MLTPSQYELLLPFRNQPMRFIDETLPEEYCLFEKRGFIKAGWAKSDDIVEWSITPLGLEALERFEQQRDQAATEARQDIEDRAKRIADRKQDRRDKWLIAILSTCGGSVLTLIIEHFQEILIALAELFH